MPNRERFVPHTVSDTRPERAVLVAVDRGRGWPLEESLAELERLTHTAGPEVVATLTQNMRTPDSRTFIGKGKLEEVASAENMTEDEAYQIVARRDAPHARRPRAAPAEAAPVGDVRKQRGGPSFPAGPTRRHVPPDRPKARPRRRRRAVLL